MWRPAGRSAARRLLASQHPDWPIIVAPSQPLSCEASHSQMHFSGFLNPASALVSIREAAFTRLSKRAWWKRCGTGAEAPSGPVRPVRRRSRMRGPRLVLCRRSRRARYQVYRSAVPAERTVSCGLIKGRLLHVIRSRNMLWRTALPARNQIHGLLDQHENRDTSPRSVRSSARNPGGASKAAARWPW